MEVADAGEEELAVPTSELGDVRNPALIGSRRGEAALQQVRCGHDLRVPASAELAAGVCADQVVVGHEPRNTIVADTMPAATQLPGDARRTIGPTRWFVCRSVSAGQGRAVVAKASMASDESSET